MSSDSGRQSAEERFDAGRFWVLRRLVIKVLVQSLSSGTHLRVAGLRGWLWSLLREPPASVRDNIRTAFPELPLDDIGRIAGAFCEFKRRLYLWRVLPALLGADNPKRWPVVGNAHLDAALARGKGILLVTAHYGYGHIIPSALATHGYAIARVIAELDRIEEAKAVESWLAEGSRMRRFIYERTEAIAPRLGPADMVAGLDVRPIFRVLAGNGIVMTAGDGLRSMTFTNHTLLGARHPFANGLMKIATMTGASVIPVFAVQDGRWDRIRVEIHPPLPVDSEASVEANVQCFVDVLEDQLRLRPHLWHRWSAEQWFEKALDWTKGDRAERYRSALR